MTEKNDVQENGLENSDFQNNGSGRISKPILITVAVAGGALALCACVLVIVALIFDPWGIVSRIRGDYDPIAQAVPEDVQLFVNVNMLQLQSQDLFNLMNKFLDAVGEETIANLQEMIDRLDEDMDTKITFMEDVQPWIGQFVGMGMKDIFSIADITSDSRFFLLVEVRNKKKADAFLVKLMDEIEGNTEKIFVEGTYERTTFYTLDTDKESEKVAFARSGSLLLVSNGEPGIKELIDAQKGNSLSDKEAYRNIISALPEDRLVGAYIDLSYLENMYQDADLFVELETSTQFEGWDGIGASLSIQDVGLQMDYIIAYDMGQLSEDALVSFEIKPGESTISTLFPENTLLFVSSIGLGRSISSVQDQLLYGYEDEELAEAMDLFEEQYGFNPSTDLYPYIDGEWGIGIVETDDGLLTEQLGIPLSILIAVESSDPSTLLSSVEKIADGLEDTTALTIRRSESNGMRLFEVGDQYSMGDVIVLGLKDNMLLLSTELDTVEDAYGDRLSLAQNTRFIEGWDYFPDDMRPIAYMDVEKTIDLYLNVFGELMGDEIEEVDVLRLFKTIQIAVRVIDESIIHSRLFIFIE